MKQNSKIEAYDMEIDENSDDIIELSSEEDGERIDKYPKGKEKRRRNNEKVKLLL